MKVLGPEFDGDGETVGRCDEAELPIAHFRAHWAPNGLLFYTGELFPEAYRGGALVAFHGGLIGMDPARRSEPWGLEVDAERDRRVGGEAEGPVRGCTGKGRTDGCTRRVSRGHAASSAS
jgi:glucose/arabinose dehydrogenase